MSAANPSPRQVSDEELVLKARTGDKNAFAVLFQRHRPTAATLVGRLLDRREDVDDVLQEAAVQALVCLDRLRAADRFGPWLCGIALNLARRQLRARTRQGRQPLGLAQPQSTEDLLVEAETAAKVRAAIGTLPSRQREAVQLFYLDSLSEAEVAAELGIARSAVKSRLHKARRSLSGHLRRERKGPVPQPSLVDVEVVDVRREPAFVPGAARTHVVVLRERGGQRTLPIFIGEPEGRALVSNLTGRQTPRPMIYQMAASMVAALSGSVAEVRVVRLSENTFIAEVALEGPSGAKVVDARPSDAINLALLVGAPIRAADELLEQLALAPVDEQADLDAYPDDANAIRAELDSPTFPSSEHLSEDAVEILALARHEAHSRSNPAVGTGHILLALLRRVVPQEAVSLGVPITAAESAVDTETRLAQANPAPPLTPRSVQVLLRAGRRASARPDRRPTPDDILAALLDEHRGLAARLMDDSAVDREAVRASLAGS
jgi:RNA polymerase sigma factor (sigma-70 family)